MVIANLLGSFLFLFLLWRTLKEDYHYEKIFNFGFSLLLGSFVGFLLYRYFFNYQWFWVMAICVFVSFILSVYRQKMNFFDSFEGFAISLLPWVSVIYLAQAVENSSLSAFILFWIGTICIALFFFFKSYYRTFVWYKSGRVGFAGIFTAALFFLFRALSNNEPYVSGTVAFIFFLVLYKLSVSKD